MLYFCVLDAVFNINLQRVICTLNHVRACAGRIRYMRYVLLLTVVGRIHAITSKKNFINAMFEVLIAILLEMKAFWDVARHVDR